MSHSLEKKREILLSTKRAWLPLDEQQPPPPREESQDSPIPETENSRQESIQQWLDSGFFITARENLQQAINQRDSLNKQGEVPETVSDYMRSLQEFSETPALSRGTSFNSCPSVPSIPKSISEWLEFWQKDPVEILLELGFGAEEPDICTKIPARFLRGSSVAKGINIRVFLEAHKQRMDFETPDLYGRFRQLEVLDHVTNAFSSLLSNVHSLQREGQEKAQAEKPKPAQARGLQERRRRIGQLLRRASKQTIRRDCMQGQAEPLRVKEDLPATAVEPDQCAPLQSVRMYFADRSHLHPLTEEQPPLTSNKLVSHEASPAGPGKPRPPLLPMSLKQSPLPCAPERSARDRGFQERGLLLSHRLRQVVHMDGKPPDSFEIEEVQSFEEEPGNSLEVTLGTIGAGVTRASSCQSDSSGFLEEPSEPFPLQLSPLLINQSLICGRQEAQIPSLEPSQYHSQEPTEDASRCILNRGQSDQEEEIFACVEKEVSPSAEPLFQEGPHKETSTGERKDNPTWNFPPSPQTKYEVDEEGTITSKYDYPMGFTTVALWGNTGQPQTQSKLPVVASASVEVAAAIAAAVAGTISIPGIGTTLALLPAHTNTTSMLSSPRLFQSTVQNMEIWRTVCQSFREHSEEIGHHLMKQQAYVLSDLSEEGREEVRQLHDLRQDLHHQVAELEFQLSDRARQIQEGMLLQFDQLLEEQSQLCSELGLTNWGEGRESTFHTDSDIHKTVSSRTPLPERTRECALTPPSSADSPEMALPSPILAEPGLASSTASWDQHVNSEEKRSFSQSRMDLKGFLGKEGVGKKKTEAKLEFLQCLAVAVAAVAAEAAVVVVAKVEVEARTPF
ncbi:protein ITPRID1 [Petaurus breviceps papuanus]|uniref:protein ITPRID1 n=1 Tax=Petaurus breviceps papuanus TaxID=3040969 RepID=UPI0036DEE3FE